MPDMAVKEIWVYLLAYNLIRLMKEQSALLADVVPRTLSFKHCLQLWTLWLQTESVLDEERLQSLLMLMAQQVVGKRPERIEPRAIKRRPKPYPLLVKLRAEARVEVGKYRHAKKVK
jgi:hypothetical protein